MKIVRTYKDQDSTFFLTWDGGNDRRKALYPQYKARRKKFEDAFYEQLNEIRKIIGYLGIKQYHFPAVEADDLIGTLTVKSRKKFLWLILILTKYLQRKFHDNHYHNHHKNYLLFSEVLF